MKVMITGSEGMLGRDIVYAFTAGGCETLALNHKELEICDFNQVKQQFSVFKPDLVVNCAAYSNVDAAESDRHAAFMVNGLGVQNLALACSQADCPLVHFSTDYVFNGKKQEPYKIFDKPDPINAYGESKLAGEHYVLSLLRRFYLIRTSWLYGHHGKNFIDTILKLAGERDEIKVVDDQFGAPTFTRDLAAAVIKLTATERYGVYHITGQGRVSWFNFARAILGKSNKKTRVIPVSSKDLSRPARRPANSVLDPFPLAETTGYLLPSWEDALERYLSERKIPA
jgi:dTDP-4-dehydrorhamnose reductase